MEQIEVLLTDKAIRYLDDLVEILYNKEYFGYIESVEIYVSEIYSFIQNNISYFPSKKTPPELQNLDTEYIFYKTKSRTTWYIFFENQDNNYLITNIINNHCEEAKWL